MQFFKAITFFSLAATGLAAAAAAPENNGESAPAKVVVGQGEPLDGDFDAAHYLATRSEYMINKRGYGCPNDYSCSNYCSSIGRNGGYCGGFLWQTCKCNEKK